MLTSLAHAGVTEAWAGDDSSDTAMTEANDVLGYQPVGTTTVRVSRRIPR